MLATVSINGEYSKNGNHCYDRNDSYCLNTSLFPGQPFKLLLTDTSAKHYLLQSTNSIQGN